MITRAGSTRSREDEDKDMKHTPTDASTRRFLSVQEVAHYTGLSVHTLYAMVSQRRIPFVKMGRLTKFDLRLLDEWIAKNTTLPMPLKRP